MLLAVALAPPFFIVRDRRPRSKERDFFLWYKKEKAPELVARTLCIFIDGALRHAGLNPLVSMSTHFAMDLAARAAGPSAAQAAAAQAAAAAAYQATVEIWVLYAIGVAVTMLRTYSRGRAVGWSHLQADDYLVWVGIVRAPMDPTPRYCANLDIRRSSTPRKPRWRITLSTVSTGSRTTA